MPLGTPGGPPARTGTDWLVVVPAWTLVVALPLGITAAIVYAIHPGPVSGALTLVLGGISAGRMIASWWGAFVGRGRAIDTDLARRS